MKSIAGIFIDFERFEIIDDLNLGNYFIIFISSHVNRSACKLIYSNLSIPSYKPKIEPFGGLSYPVVIKVYKSNLINFSCFYSSNLVTS